jgi:hypothetical protein
MRAGHNQYAPMTGVPALRQAIAGKTERCYGCATRPDSEVTVTSGATEAIFDAIHAVVRAGDEVIVLDPCYDCYEPAIDLAGARRRCTSRWTRSPSRGLGRGARGDHAAHAHADGQQPAQPVRRDVRRRRHAGAGRPAARHRHRAAQRRGLRAHRLRRRPPRSPRCAIRNCASAPSSSPASARPTTAPAGRSATASRRRP